MKKMLQRIGQMLAVMTTALLLAVPATARTDTVRLAVGVDDIGTLDPHFSTRIGEVPIIRMIYEPMMRHPPGEINIEEIEPALAERWELEDDKLTWNFYLRKGVQWHEGYGEFTAEDVKFSLERVLDEKTGTPFRKKLLFIDSITVINPYQVQIKTKEIVPFFPALLVDNQQGFIVCKKAVEKLGRDIKFHPIGTGPFKFHSYKPRESFTLTANTDYWRGRPKLSRVVVSFIPDNSTRELALRSGEVHAVNIPAKQEWIDRMKKAGMDVNLTSPANMFVLHYNMTIKPLDNINVRRALCHAIDRQEIINFLGKDVAKVEISPLPSGYVGHTEDVIRYEHSVAKAKELLEKAGYADGFTLEMNISNSDIYLPPMQVIQEQWKKIGVTLKLNVVDHPTYHKLIRQDVNPVVIYGAYRYPLTGDIYLTQFYHSESIVGKKTAIINFSHYGDILDSVDEYIDDARYETNLKKQKALWEEAQKQIKKDAVSFPLFTRVYAMAKTPKLELGFEQKSWSFYDIKETSYIKD